MPQAESSEKEAEFSQKDLETARDRFYPEWWLHLTHARRTDMPRYLVVCRSREDEDLALASKPDYLDVRLKLLF